jgi:hypothetical protein
VDLRHTCPQILARYMGKDNTSQFFAWHASKNPQAA